MSEIKLKRSSVIENGAAKAPTPGQLAHGELALNFAVSDPTIFYKDSNNDVREIKLAVQPDLTIATAQSGTFDDRYLRLSGGTLTGDLVGPSFTGGVVTISATAPTSSEEGQLWYNTNDGRLYVYYTDADSSQWVDAAPDTLETLFTNTDRLKLDGIEDGAQVNTVTSVNGQTGAVTVAGNTNLSYAPTTRELASSTGTSAILPEVVAGGNSGLMTGAAQTKLDGIETNATADQTGAEIKQLYELEANAFTDTLFNKLTNIEAGAQVNTVLSVNGETGAVVVGSTAVVISDTAPTDNSAGDLWYDSDSSELYIWYVNDGDTDANGQWIQTSAPQVPVDTNLSYDAATRTVINSVGTDAVLPEVVAAGDSGLMTGADKTKLDGIEASATADQTGAEIKAAYEAEADTNAFTDAQVTKLAGIEAGAQLNVGLDGVTALDSNSTNNITLGTDKITLDATDGEANFEGDVTVGTDKIVLNSLVGTASFYQGAVAISSGVMTTDPSIRILSNNDSARQAITVDNGGGPQVSINMDGSGEFAGDIEIGDTSQHTLNANGDADLGVATNAEINIGRGTGTTAQLVQLATSSNSGMPVMTITSAGRFGAGDTDNVHIAAPITIGPSQMSPGVSLEEDGSASFAGSVTVAGNAVWHEGNDGSGSGLDADLWDGNQFSSYLNQALLTTSSPNFGNVHASDWFRNSHSGEGLYNTTNDAHFYSADGAYWHLNGDSGNMTYGGLILYSQYNATADGSLGRRGYLYWDSSGFGLLGRDGSWGVNLSDDGKNIVLGGNQTLNHYDDVSSVRLSFGGGNDMNNYSIGTSMEDFNGNYTKLDIRWHTGIRVGAQKTYGGIRFYDSEDFGSVLLSIGKTDANTRLEGGDFHITSSNMGSGGTTAFGSMTGMIRWDELNAYSDTARGPNRLVTQGATNWIAGLGIHSSTQAYYSGEKHSWYRGTNATTFTHQMTLDGSGNLTATGNVTAFSDVSLKENIEVIPNALEKISEIRGVTYDRKDVEGARHAGVIAQEVEAVLPEVVQTDEDGIKSVAYGNMVSLLIEAVKELKTQNEELREMVLALKNNPN